VGSESCRDCHRNEYDKWNGSHHQLAMAVASDETVLGDFADAEFTISGCFTLLQKDGRFMVATRGPGGEMGDFEITHTFGWFPLQQYLVPFPDGRCSACPLPGIRQGRIAGITSTRTADWPRRLAVLDQQRPELERHVRRVPLHGPAQELRPGRRHLPHGLVGDQRGLRSLPRPGIRPCGLGPAARDGPARVAKTLPSRSNTGDLPQPAARSCVRPATPAACPLTTTFTHADFLDYGIPQLLSEGMYFRRSDSG
jgi:hypothetical protein